MRAAALAVGAGLLAASPAALAGGLLDGLGLAPDARPQGTVAVTGWVESGPGGTELVVRIEPRGAAKLVAEPGVTVTPVPHDGIAWAGGPATLATVGGGYFPAPVEMRLPFTARDGRPVEAEVEYAYCLVDYQCLFGEARVSAAPPRCAADTDHTLGC